MNLQNSELKTVLINGVECLFTDIRAISQTTKPNSKYPYKYDVRHGDDGEPCSIEKKVYVNYFGTILAPESFLKKGSRLSGGRKYRDIDVCECGCGCPSFLFIGDSQ